MCGVVARVSFKRKCFVLCETERVVWHFLIFRERLALDMGDAS